MTRRSALTATTPWKAVGTAVVLAAALTACSSSGGSSTSSSTPTAADTSDSAATSAATSAAASTPATTAASTGATGTGTVAALTLTAAQIALAKKNADGATIGILSPLSSEYLSDVVTGAKQAAGTLGLKTVVVDYDFDDAKAVAGVENLVSQGVKYMVVDLTDPPAMLGAVQAAQSKGVTVIQFAGDQVAKAGKGYSVAINDQDLGTAIGTATADIAKTRGAVQIAILDYPSQPNVVIRANAMKAAIHAGAPQAKIVGSETGGTQEAGLSASEDLLQKYPKLAGVASVNDAGAYGAVQALTSAGRTSANAFVVGCDAESKARQAIAAGTIFKATVDTQPALTGKAAVEVIGKLLAGGHPAQYTTVPVKTITK